MAASVPLYAVPTTPLGSDVVVIETPLKIVRPSPAVPVPPTLSFTVAFTVKGPAACGVPEITPPVEIVNPVGNPVAVQVYPVPLPPVAVSVSEYAIPNSPFGSGEVVVIVGPEITVRLNDPEELPFRLSFTVTVKVNGLPAALGVPESAPVLASVSPGGKVPPVTLQV